MWLTLLFLLIFMGCLAALYTEGMWGNAIRLINVVTAALLATNYWEPAVRWLEGFSQNLATFTYLLDFLTLWGLFVVFMIIFRLITDRLSRVKVRFLKIADRIGSVAFAIWIGWVMVCFTAMSLHMAPMGRNFFFGAFVPEQRPERFLCPEMKWLGFMQKQSRGALCRTATKDDIRKQPVWEDDRTRTFDPRGEFMPKYASRRAKLEAYNNEHKALRVRPEHLREHLPE